MKALFYIHSLNIGGAEMIVSEYMIELKKQGSLRPFRIL